MYNSEWDELWLCSETGEQQLFALVLCSLHRHSACAALLPFGLHVHHHYSVYQFSHNAQPLTVTGPRPLASKARRPPGGSAVPWWNAPPT